MTVPAYYELRVRDNADTLLDVRWTDDDGTPFAITSAAAQIRATEASATILVTATATLLGAPDHWVRFKFAATDIAAADFEALTDADEPAFWDCTLTRTSDSTVISPAAGRVVWNKGVTR